MRDSAPGLRARGRETITYVGPFGHPEIVTALQVAVGGPNGEYSQVLNFRYEHNS